jgi:WD40 repeat protein
MYENFQMSDEEENPDNHSNNNSPRGNHKFNPVSNSFQISSTSGMMMTAATTNGTTLNSRGLSPHKFHFLFQELEKEFFNLLQENEALKQRVEEYERILISEGHILPSPIIHSSLPVSKTLNKRAIISQNSVNMSNNHNNGIGNVGIGQNSQNTTGAGAITSHGALSSNMDKLSKKFANPYQKMKNLISQSKISSLPVAAHGIAYNWTNKLIVSRFYFHTDVINNVVCVPSYGNAALKRNPLIASCSMDHTVCMFYTSRKPEERIVQRPDFVYRGHRGAVNTVCFHPTNPIACSASGDGTVHLWKWENSKRTTKDNDLSRGITAPLPVISIGNVVTEATDRLLYQRDGSDPVIDISAPEIRRDKLNSSHNISDFQYNDDSNNTGNNNNNINIINNNNINNNREEKEEEQEQEEEEQEQEEKEEIATQDLLSTSEFMTQNSQENDDIPHRSTPLMMFDHEGPVVIAAQFHQNRSNTEYNVVSASWDRCIRQWDINTGKLMSKVMNHECMNACSSSSDNNYVPNFEYHKNETQITDLQSAYHNPWIVTACNNGLCKILDTVSNQFTHQFHHTKEQATNMETCAIFSPNDRMVITAAQDGVCKIWDMRKLSDKTFLKSFSVHTGINRVSISSYHSRFCVATNKRQIKIYDLSGKCLNTLQKQGHDMMVTGVAWSENGEDVFSCGADRSILHWNLGKNDEQQCNLTGNKTSN